MLSTSMDVRLRVLKRLYAVTGQFGDIIRVEFNRMENLGEIIREIQSIGGVHRTQTLIIIPPPIRK